MRSTVQAIPLKNTNNRISTNLACTLLNDFAQQHITHRRWLGEHVPGSMRVFWQHAGRVVNRCNDDDAYEDDVEVGWGDGGWVY